MLCVLRLVVVVWCVFVVRVFVSCVVEVRSSDSSERVLRILIVIWVIVLC